MDLLKTEQIIDNTKALKAVDLIGEMMKEQNRSGNNMAGN